MKHKNKNISPFDKNSQTSGKLSITLNTLLRFRFNFSIFFYFWPSAVSVPHHRKKMYVEEEVKTLPRSWPGLVWLPGPSVQFASLSGGRMMVLLVGSPVFLSNNKKTKKGQRRHH